MVALESAPPRTSVRPRERSSAWLLGSGVVLAVGTLVRIGIGGRDLPALSGSLLAVLLWLAVWLAALLLSSPRTAFFASLATMIVLDVAALPPRTSVEYDDRTVLYRTDQALVISLPPEPIQATQAMLTLLVEPTFTGPHADFGLVGRSGATRVEWTCPFRIGVQRLALPLPPGTAGDLMLSLTGQPSRAGQFLVVFTAAARRGGPLGDVLNASALPSDTVVCSAR